VILWRLVVFAGVFRLEAASAVIASPRSRQRKSWTASPISSRSRSSLWWRAAPSRYRLLDTMRAYGLEKLAESGECQWLARRHAEHCRDLIERAEAQ
jgi:predicted ATPase